MLALRARRDAVRRHGASETGAALDLGVGYASTAILSRIVTARTDIVVNASLRWSGFHLVAGFLGVTTILSLRPAMVLLRQSVVGGLRASGAYDPLPQFPVSPGGSVRFAPGELAIRLSDLSTDLDEGTHIDVELTTDRGSVLIDVEIGAADATPHSHAGHAHGRSIPTADMDSRSSMLLGPMLAARVCNCIELQTGDISGLILVTIGTGRPGQFVGGL